MQYYLIINGPNLNLLGRRQPEIYGTATIEDINRAVASHLLDGENLESLQYNGEGEIIDALHHAGFDNECSGIILNAGAYTHSSHAIADAIAAIETPVVEVHISNIHSREDFRSRSVIAPYCAGSISGFGEASYVLGILALRMHNAKD